MDGRVGIRAHWSFQQVSPHSLSLSLSLLLLSYYYYYEYANLLYPVLPAASIHILLIAILLILLSLSHSTLIAIIIFDKPDINNFYRNRRRMPP